MPPINNRIRKRKAYTLIEMLLVVSLMGMTGLAVYHAIANGIRVWEYSRRYSAEEDVAIFFEKIAADLQNSFSYSQISFDGRPEKIFFPTIVHVPVDKKIAGKSNEMVDQMGGVEYFIQKGKKTIFRRTASYGQATDHKFSEARALASPVQSLRFTYIYFVDGERQVKNSLKGSLPVSIQIDVDFLEVGGHVRRFTRMINLPVSLNS